MANKKPLDREKAALNMSRLMVDELEGDPIARKTVEDNGGSKNNSSSHRGARMQSAKPIDRPLVERYPEVANDDRERLLADVRRHWLGKFSILFTGGMTVALLIIIALGLSTISSKSGLFLSGELKVVLTAVLLLVAVLVVIGTYIAYWVYTHSRLLITDQNVIELRQISLFARRTSHLNMINVEDVTVIKHGILQTVLNYGTLQIETAGDNDNFEFINTPNPDIYRHMVINAHERAIEHVGKMGSAQRLEIVHNGL